MFTYQTSFETFEPQHDKTNKMCVHPAKTQISLGIRQSLLSAWRNLGSLTTHWVHSELIRLGGWPGWSESSLGAHSFCWFCHVVAQFWFAKWNNVWSWDDSTMVVYVSRPSTCFCPKKVELQKWKTLNKMKKRDKQCWQDTPRTVMVNKENYYWVYNGHTKWLSLISSHFVKKNFFLHDTSSCTSSLYQVYVQSIRKLQ